MRLMWRPGMPGINTWRGSGAARCATRRSRATTEGWDVGVEGRVAVRVVLRVAGRVAGRLRVRVQVGVAWRGCWERGP